MVSMSISRTPKARRHHHLTRENISRSALELIDRDGLDGLSMRRLAAILHVRATNLYPYVADKENLLRSVLELLLSEIELPDPAGLSWEDCVVSVGASLRETALRHPRAFPLLALAPYDDPALIAYAGRVERVFVAAGLPEELLPRLASLLDAHAVGYLLLETQVLAGSESVDSSGASLPRAAGVVGGAQEHEEAMKTIIAGFKVRNRIG
jgi:AcrR family transcriptional regulator